jgi:hypothetical protein
MTHVWQYQKLPDYSWEKALAEQKEFGSDAYTFVLDQRKSLADYRFEQQATILQNYYYRKLEGLPVSDYESVIYRSIQK